MALSSAEAKSEVLNAQKKKLDAVMKKTQDIIDQMLPKHIAAVSNFSQLIQLKLHLAHCNTRLESIA